MLVIVFSQMELLREKKWNWIRLAFIESSDFTKKKCTILLIFLFAIDRF